MPEESIAMSLYLFFVAQIVPEEQEFYSHGNFVIDTPSNFGGQDEILALLSTADMRKIGEKLGIVVTCTTRHLVAIGLKQEHWRVCEKSQIRRWRVCE
jgi:hypothetical protein